MGSTRLPGKVLLDIAGEPMLARVLGRAGRAHTLGELVLATTTDHADDPIVELCRLRGISSYRGHPTDVLDRFYRAAQRFGAEVIVRLTGDCPLLDASVVDQTVQAFLEAEQPVDMAANRFPGDRTFPIGLDTEVCSFAALERAWREARAPHEREHVMPFLYDPPGRFRVLHVRGDRNLGDLRWTVDTAEDLEFVRQVYAHFSPREDFGWTEVLDLVDAHPEIASINAHVPHKSLREV